MVTARTKIALISTLSVLLIAAVVLVLVFFFAIDKGPPPKEEGCEIYAFDVDPHPLIVLSGSSDFLYPIWGEKVLKFSANQSVDFICPGRLIVFNTTSTNNSLLIGTCAGGQTFQIGDQRVNWSEISCDNYPWRHIQATGNTCATSGQELEVGFNVDDGRFLRTLLICFNPTLQIAYYTYINQTYAINQRVLYTPRPSWLQGSGIYKIGIVTSLYVRSNQRATINGLLGLTKNSTKYIKDTNNYFLARGHMTARSDNYYAAAQNATFFMQNIAPQWQLFNGYNWNQIEIDVRDYAAEKGVYLQVWSGIHGVTTLPHEETGEATELYLYVTNTTKALPVPEIFWKVVYEPISERGVALIGVNNPYNKTFSPLCFDVSSRITWLHCDKMNQIWGFCYACYITTFRYVVTTIPNVSDRGLLL